MSTQKIIDEVELGDSEVIEEAQMARLHNRNCHSHSRWDERRICKICKKLRYIFCIILIEVYLMKMWKYKCRLGQLGLFKGLDLCCLSWAPRSSFPIKGLKEFTKVKHRNHNLLVIGYLRGSYRIQYSSPQVYRLDDI